MQQEKPLYKQLYQIFKKLVLILTIFAPMTEIRKKDIVTLD